MTNSSLDAIKTNVMYLAAKEADADAIIEPMFHSWTVDTDNKTIYVEMSGYPVKYINFRAASKNDIEMIGVVYPMGNSSVTIDATTTHNTDNSKNGNQSASK